MMSWSPTPARTAVSTLTDLWRHPAWRSSTYAPSIQAVLRTKLTDPDDVVRLHLAQVVHLLDPDDETTFELVRERLLTENQILVSAVLLNGLSTFAKKRPADVDALLATLADREPWSGLLNEAERTPDQLEPLGVFTGLALALTIRHRTPLATKLTRNWMSAPTETQTAWHALSRLRAWIELLANRDNERTRAFELLNLAITSVVELRDTATGAPERTRAAYTIADLIARNLYFASGAHADGGVNPTPPAPGFAEKAFAALEVLACFKHPTITHSLVETLGHLAPADPARAFRLVAAAVGTGDEYTYDQLAADETTKLIERYLAEFRAIVVVDNDLLTAIRSVLHAFVDAGWPTAISLAYRLSEAFR
jgi:hypothetical protein